MSKKAKSISNIEKTVSQTKKGSLYDKKTYMLMAAGVFLIILGFVLMAGGGTPLGPDGYAHEFDESIYSFRRITLAPIIIFIGFIVEVVAVMYPNKTAKK